MKKLLALFLSVACLFCCGFAESTDGNNGWRQAYIAMLEEFDRGNYEDALTAAEIVYEANPNYQEIVSYYNYLTALLVFLPGGQYEKASSEFELLALRHFMKSEGYAAYAKGCQYEAEEKYAEALERLEYAFSNGIDEAYLKIRECREKASVYPEDEFQSAYSNGIKYLEGADESERKGQKKEAEKQVEQALTLFRVLANSKYDDSENLVTYCKARIFELQGMYQKALDLYETLPNTYDSGRRYVLLTGGSEDPAVESEELLLIRAKAYKETDLYAGPGFSYLQEDMKISGKDELWIAGQYEDWYLIEFIPGEKKARAWAQKFRIGREEEKEPTVFEKAEGKILQEIIPAYGPGEDYVKREEILTSDTAVQRMAEDHGYTLVEYEVDGKGFATGWVQTEFVQ